MKQDSRTPILATELLAATPLSKPLARIRLHEAILGRIRDCLPETLAAHCRDCVVTNDSGLIVFTDGPAWTFQLRFHAPALLEKLSETSEFQFRSLEIRNLYAVEPVRRRPFKPLVSRESAMLIRNCATETSSPELAAALARLAATLESNGGKE